MKSVTLLFPGQGAQYVGMGEDLESNYKELFTQADESLGFEISKIMSEGPAEELTLTKNTQPAIVSYSVALFRKLEGILEQKNIKIDRVLGHSVGEYSALVAAGAISFKDAVKAVNLRGTYMQEAVPAGVGSMYAIMKIGADIVSKACAAASEPGSEVMPANFNEPNQTVISGKKDACERAVKWIEENVEGRFRAIELNVSAPFHCSLMKPAEEKLNIELNNFEFNSPKLNYIANIDAKEYDTTTSPELIKQNLVKQVCGSVQWVKSIENLADDTICIEVGPGKVLQGLARKINKNIKVISLDKGGFSDLMELLEC